MANPINDGGPAFPVIPPQDEHGIGSAPGYPFPDTGMSLRDWFAGQVMPVVIAATSAGQHSPEFRHDDISAVLPMARDAYALADAMLTAREAKP
jgi:hypothetical protein